MRLYCLMKKRRKVKARRKPNFFKIISFIFVIALLIAFVIFAYIKITGKVILGCSVSEVKDVPEYKSRIINGVDVWSFNANYNPQSNGSAAMFVIGRELYFNYTNPVQTIIRNGETYAIKLVAVYGTSAVFDVTNPEGVSKVGKIFPKESGIQHLLVNGLYISLAENAYYANSTFYHARAVVGSFVQLEKPAKTFFTSSKITEFLPAREYTIELISSTDSVNTVKVSYPKPCEEIPEEEKSCNQGKIICFFKQLFNR